MCDNIVVIEQWCMMCLLFHLSAPLTSSPVWARDFSSSEELITEFCRECRIVRKGIAIASAFPCNAFEVIV